MVKEISLFTGKETDRHKQSVQVNQIIRMEGYSYHKYVVYEIAKNERGLYYKLINLSTKAFQTAELIKPLNEKFGIGYYYDSENPQFMDSLEVAMLYQEAQQKEKEAGEEAEREKVRIEEVKKAGQLRFAGILPQNAQAIIVGRLKQDESNIMTDYFASSIQRTVILGFSEHRRDLFSEMRKHALNFEGTTYLAEYNAEYEHREKYAMGGGYYLGASKYSGWIIEKVPIYNRESSIEAFALIAGNEENICLKSTPADESNHSSQTITGDYNIVDYSDKAVAIFGDTKPIKALLSQIGGRFNPRLTFNGERKAGWIFQKSKEQEIKKLLNL